MSKSAIVIEYEHTVGAIGWLSAYLADKADAWNGNAPEWFPQPPEWLDLWDRALAEARADD